jgi:hypothetical protein
MAKFNSGDAVAWSHTLGAIHGDGSVIKKSAVEAQDSSAKFGTVTTIANAEETWFSVALDGGEERVLTGDELVRVAPEE